MIILIGTHYDGEMCSCMQARLCSLSSWNTSMCIACIFCVMTLCVHVRV